MIKRCAWLMACLAGWAFPQNRSEPVAFFESKIRPLLSEHCYSCHSSNAKTAFAGLRLDTRETLLRGSDGGAVIVPGKPEASRLIKAVRYEAGLKMPPTGKLTPDQIEALTEWVRIGAPWGDAPSASTPQAPPKVATPETRLRHWAWQPLAKPLPPSVRESGWSADPIDRFILSRLEQNGLAPAADVDRATLLRRVFLDLTGLPPAPSDVERFLRDDSPDAFEKIVDRLLASPAFGQRWGRHWLDQTYYADNIEIGRRVPAMHAWRYRDYVIDALNRDMPYDQFIKEQIAGDQMEAADPSRRREQIVATGFLALGPWALVAADKEQLRMDVVDLQIDLVGKTFLGLTLGCARCHDHKFDPIPNRDYYGMAGIFRSTQTLSGRLGLSVFSNVNTVALPELPDEMIERARLTREYTANLNQARDRLKKLQDERKAQPKTSETPAGASKSKSPLDKQITEAENQVALLEFLAPTAPIAHAVQDVETPGDCRINVRGNAHQLGDETPRTFVSIVMTGSTPEIADWRSGRMELADWIANPKNPLTARVLVNRTWHHLFGAGIVRTIDNFGLRGDAPSHPELLDYLAGEFVQNGWSLKKLIRRIVLTRTYRLASTAATAAREKDPENRLLSHMNPHRLEAEAIRDSVLAISGELDLTHGGPTLPLRLAGNLSLGKPESLKDDAKLDPVVQHRRSVYLPVLRKSQLPELDLFNLFNFPDVNQVTGARPGTTIPTQALYLMNSPFIIAEARAVARRLLGDTALSDQARVERLILLVYGRPARGAEVAQALEFIGSMQKQFPSSPSTSSQAESARLEAWGRYCHALFVSNEFLYRS